MNRVLAFAVSASLAIWIAGCSQPDSGRATATPARAQGDADQDAPDSAIGKLIQAQTSALARGIEQEPLIVTAADRALPAARIDPDGTVRIGEETLALSAEQRSLALRYRRETLAPLLETMKFAAAGMDDAGAILRTYAAGVLADDMEKADEAARGIAKATDRRFQSICPNTQAQLDAQAALATAVPAFAPYAKIDQADVDKCSTADGGGAATASG